MTQGNALYLALETGEYINALHNIASTQRASACNDNDRNVSNCTLLPGKARLSFEAIASTIIYFVNDCDNVFWYAFNSFVKIVKSGSRLIK